MKPFNYPFVIKPLSHEDGGGYLIEFPDLPGCVADGETIEEAICEAHDAMSSWIKSCQLHDEPIPKPYDASKYSGQWRLRIPKSLHAALAFKAKQEGVSLNTLAATLLAAGINAPKDER